MPFQFSEGGVPYHPPVAPELPGRVNIPQGDFVGNSIVNAFVHRAIASEQAQLDQQRMMQTADLQAQHLQYQDKWQTQDYEIAKQNADSLSKYREQEASNHIAAKSARDQAISDAQARKQAQQEAAVALTSQINVNDMRSDNFLATSKFFDQGRLNEDPAGVIKDFHVWDMKFGESQLGSVPEQRKKMVEYVNNISVPFVPGAEFVTAKGDTSSTATYLSPGHIGKIKEDPNKQLDWRVVAKNGKDWVPANTAVQPFRVKDLADQWADPTNRPRIENGLIAAGHGTIEHSVDADGNPIAVPHLDKWAERMLQGFSKTPNPKDLESRVPDSLKSKFPKWQIEAGAGNSLGGGGGGFDINTERAQAQRGIELNPAAENAIKAEFRAVWGEDL